MTGSNREWERRRCIGWCVVLLAAVGFGGCGESGGERSPADGQTTVSNADTTMNVTFYAFTDEDGGSRAPIASGTFEFDRSGLERGQFDARWNLSTPERLGGPGAEIVAPDQLVDKYCLTLLNGSGSLRASTTGENGSFKREWSLNLQPNVVDNNMMIALTSVTDEAWSGVWFYVTDAGVTDQGAFEAAKAGG
jgi:hypothetical protein